MNTEGVGPWWRVKGYACGPPPVDQPGLDSEAKSKAKTGGADGGAGVVGGDGGA